MNFPVRCRPWTSWTSSLCQLLSCAFSVPSFIAGGPDAICERKARAADVSRRFYSVTTPVDAPCRTTSAAGLGRAPLLRSFFDRLPDHKTDHTNDFF